MASRPEQTLRSDEALESERTARELLPLRYGIEDKPPPVQLVLFGLQHVLVMFVAMVASPLAVGQLLNLPQETRVTLVTSCMLGSGIGTLVASLGVGFIGPRLPIVMGIWAPLIGQIVAIAKASSLGAATSTMVIGGLIVFFLSPAYAKLRRFFPPVVVGTVLLVAGTALMKIGLTITFGTNTPFFAKPVTLILLFGSIVLIIVLNRLGRGLVRLLSLFLTLVCAYFAAVPLGLANFDPIFTAPWFRIPTLVPYGLEWPDVAGLIGVLVIMLVAAVEATSLALAVCDIVGIQSSERHIIGVVSADGLCSAISAVFGGIPSFPHSERRRAYSDRRRKPLCGCGRRRDPRSDGVGPEDRRDSHHSPAVRYRRHTHFHVRHDRVGRCRHSRGQYEGAARRGIGRSLDRDECRCDVHAAAGG
jgi:xanthine/uracil permease